MAAILKLAAGYWFTSPVVFLGGLFSWVYLTDKTTGFGIDPATGTLYPCENRLGFDTPIVDCGNGEQALGLGVIIAIVLWLMALALYKEWREREHASM